MATGIILIVLSGLGFLLASGVDNEDLRIALYIGPFTALVAGIGLINQARRLIRREQKAETERRLMRLEVEQERAREGMDPLPPEKPING